MVIHRDLSFNQPYYFMFIYGLIRLLYYLHMERWKKKIKRLIKEIKENKNPVLMPNRVLDAEEINWLYGHTKPKHEE